jgi:tetratricopeptide (TPR) repeat protein
MRTALQQARTAFAEVGDSWGLAMSLFLDTGRLMMAGELDAARKGIDEAQEALAGLNPDTGGGMFDIRMADVLLRLGNIDEARERARRARDRRDSGADDMAFAQATLARIAWVAGDREGAQAELQDARERLERRRRVLPEQSHGWALIQALSAIMAAEAGELDAAEGYLATGLPLALATTDMPVVSAIAVAAAHVATARGKLDEAAELLGAAAAIRGADDLTSPEIAAIRDETRSAAYDRGRALSREEALARLEASASRAAPVGP